MNIPGQSPPGGHGPPFRAQPGKHRSLRSGPVSAPRRRTPARTAAGPWQLS